MDTRTTTRWAVEELEWLRARAKAAGHGQVGTATRELVQSAMAAEARLLGKNRSAPAARVGEGPAQGGSAAAGATVPGAGAAAAPRPAAAPATARRREVKLEVVVAVHLQGGSRVIAGLQPPAMLVRARKAIASGRVSVSGHGPFQIGPGTLVGAGEVFVDGEPVTASWV